MEDSHIVALMAAGDTGGLEAAYDAYADRLHDYAVTLLPGAVVQQAPDVVRRALQAAQAAKLALPERLRPFLYSTVREECARLGKPSAAGKRARLEAVTPQDRLYATVTTMSTDRREIYDLVCRHSLSPQEAAEISGRTVNVTYADLIAVRELLGRSHGPLEGRALLALSPLVAAPASLRAELMASQAEVAAADPRVPLYEISPAAHAERHHSHRRKRPPVARWALGAVSVLLCAGVVLSQLRGDGADRSLLDIAPTTPVLPTHETQPSVTLEPAPAPAVQGTRTGATSAAPPIPSPTAETSSPEPSPSRRTTRRPKPPKKTTKPRPSPTTQAPAPVARLTVSKTSLNLAREGDGSIGEVVLRATGARIRWTATTTGDSARWLYVGEMSGSLGAGEQQGIDLVVDPEIPPTIDTLQVVFGPGDLLVTIHVT